MKTFSVTDAGVVREMNQDYYFSSDTAVGNLPNLFIVADGMGGHKAGDYASRYTIERVVASVSRNTGEEPIAIMKEAINKANELLVAESREDESKFINIFYENDDAGWYKYRQMTVDWNSFLDTEEGDWTSVTIGQYPGVYIEKNDTGNLWWFDYTYAYQLQGNLSEKEMIAVAESLTEEK